MQSPRLFSRTVQVLGSHQNMQAIADAFEGRGIATLRFNFPFMEAGKSRTDPPAVATAAIAAAFTAAKERTALPILLGGHSFGGRMASHAVLDRDLDPAGMVFCSFPLHPSGSPAIARAAHLSTLKLPMLFLSGTRDELASRELLEQVVSRLPNDKQAKCSRGRGNSAARSACSKSCWTCRLVVP